MVPQLLESDKLEWLRQHRGPLTEELLLHPARFGLGSLPVLQQPDATTTMTCGFCSTGCGLKIHLRNGEAINLTPDTDYPVNLGMACPKGWEALNVLKANDRATTPLLRTNSSFTPVAWSTAMHHFCYEFKKIQKKYGNESLAFISTGQMATEEMALLGCLAKFGMGMLHGDGNTRQCMATAVSAYKESFGFDAPPYTYADFEESDCIVLIGSNLCIAHPILWQRVLRNERGAEIIVIDPRKTETALAATTHLQIKPKSDLILFYGLAKLLLDHGYTKPEFIERHTENFEAFAEHVQTYTLAKVASATGIASAVLERTAHALGKHERVSYWWTMGINQSYEGVRAAQSIINLALMTGNLGRPGTGANSITGQCNAMGSRLFSNTTNLLGGHDFRNAAHREKIASVLQINAERIPKEPSWAYDQIIEGIRNDKIKGLWIIATNTAHSWIDQHDTRALLKKLDFLVVQDMYHSTETAQLANLVLPAAGWGEKEGTFINSERRFGLFKRLVRAPGEALADFSIFRLVADAWGCGSMFKEWTNPEAAFQFMKAASRGQPCDISGIQDYEQIDRAGGIQWPCPETTGAEQPDTQRRLFADGTFFHANGKARFIFASPGNPPEIPNEEYPLWLLTGRGTAAQWHTQTRTSKSPVLRTLYPAEVYVELHPHDAAPQSINSGDEVMVVSRRGSVLAKAVVTPTVQPGQIFLPMHYEAVNRLTLNHVDPISRQPSYKDCAVRISKIKG